MRRIDFQHPEPLHGSLSTRIVERAAASGLPDHALMARAGLALSRLTQALAPHARSIWVACGPGNNGGDGLIAAAHLTRFALSHDLPLSVSVTLAGNPDHLPDDAAHALLIAKAAGVRLLTEPPEAFDFAIDALLGIGVSRAPEGVLASHLEKLENGPAPVLCVDLPSGLKANSGEWLGSHHGKGRHPGPRHTLSLLTLKPGLFTAQGRDAAGDIWLDTLGIDPVLFAPADALLSARPPSHPRPPRLHATHKGSHGEVLVIGGQGMEPSGVGMTGAAVLAARAALRTGAGRVYLCTLRENGSDFDWDPLQPELMPRSPEAAMAGDLLERSAVVCGCGGGEAVAPLMAPVLSRARQLVLDADALNAIAEDPALQSLLAQRRAKGWITVLTPHPLEAARLLGSTTGGVMSDRLGAARAVSETFGAICVLKGSGTVIHAPEQTPLINASGNGALATAGTGDVLAGMIGTALAAGNLAEYAFERIAQAVFDHGNLADRWAANQGQRPLCADQLTRI